MSMISFGLFTNPWNINTLNETNLHFRNSLLEEQLRYAQKMALCMHMGGINFLSFATAPENTWAAWNVRRR
jgi:hypothetical protein